MAWKNKITKYIRATCFFLFCFLPGVSIVLYLGKFTDVKLLGNSDTPLKFAHLVFMNWIIILALMLSALGIDYFIPGFCDKLTTAIWNNESFAMDFKFLAYIVASSIIFTVSACLANEFYVFMSSLIAKSSHTLKAMKALDAFCGIGAYCLFFTFLFIVFQSVALLFNAINEKRINKSQLKKIGVLALNIIFVPCLVFFYHQIPWYGFVGYFCFAMALTYLTSEDKTISGTAKKILDMMTFSSYLAFSLSNAASLVPKFMRVMPIVVGLISAPVRFFSNSRKEICEYDRYFYLFSAVCLTGGMAVIGFFQIPKGLELLFPNLNQRAASVLAFTILILGSMAILGLSTAALKPITRKWRYKTKAIFPFGRTVLSLSGAAFVLIIGYPLLKKAMADLPIWLLALVASLAFIYNAQLFYVSMAGVNNIPGVLPVARFIGKGVESIFSCFCPQAEPQAISPPLRYS